MIWTYVIIAAILLIAELVYFMIADHFNIIDKPNERSSHSTIVLRGGGEVQLDDELTKLVATELTGQLVVEGGLGTSIIAIVGLMHLLVLAAPAGEEAVEDITRHERVEPCHFALDLVEG